MTHHRTQNIIALALLCILIGVACSNAETATPTARQEETPTRTAVAPPSPSPSTRATATAAVDAPVLSSPVRPAADSPLPAENRPELSPESMPKSPIAPSPIEPPRKFSESPIASSPIHPPSIDQPQAYTYRIINTFDHDPAAYTQGLVYVDGWLYESTGLRGQSSLRKVELATGAVEQILKLPVEFYGEGMTVLGDKIYQVTWQAGTGFVYDINDFALLEQFSYTTEGWGLTHDGEHLYLSDGTATVYVIDPLTMDQIDQIQVTDRGTPVVMLNELEFVGGRIYANVWQTDRIAIIDPQSGVVSGWIDLAGLLPPQERAHREAVLNGIAYDAENHRLFVTGKLWPKLFEVEILKAD